MLKVIKGKVPSMVLYLILLILVLPTAVFAQAGVSREAEEHILNELRRANIPNAAIAVIQDGETSYIFRNSAHDTLFQIGSVSKSFTGIGVLLLEDMGLLSVHDPVNQYLSWFEVNYSGVPVPHEDITIYNLLHHTSGFTNDERRFPANVINLSKDNFTAQLTGIELAFYPSTEFMYGNLNYVILGFLIEAISGRSYDEFMTAQVLRPLGLYNTFTNVQNAHDTGLVIGGNRLRFMQPTSWNPPVDPLSIPTGFIYSNIEDMARWAGIQHGIINVSEQFSRIVQRSHEHNHDSDVPFASKDFFYAAGWFVNFEDNSIRHGGAVPGYTAIVKIFQYSNTAVVVLSNLRYDSMERLAMVVLDSVESRAFDSIGIDFFAILDIAFSILTVVGVVYVGLLVWLAMNAIKRLSSREVIKPKFTRQIIKWLIDPILSIAGLIAFYIIVPHMFGSSYANFALLSPASVNTAGIAIWVIVAYYSCAFMTKVFGLPAEKTQKSKK